jgi:hypothetical protein
MYVKFLIIFQVNYLRFSGFLFLFAKQSSLTTLNSRAYTNRISMVVFLLHTVVAVALVCFLIFKGVQGLIGGASTSIKRKEKNVLMHYLPQVEAASLLSITLAFTWQKALREWPTIMIHFILWSSFLMTLSAGILLICFQKPPTDGVGVCFIAFAIGIGLYACWVTQRIGFCCKVLMKGWILVDVPVDFSCGWSLEFLLSPIDHNCIGFELGLDC